MIGSMNGYGRAARTLAIALIAGVSSALVVAFFGFCLSHMISFVEAMGPRFWLAAPLISAAVVGLLILRKYPYAGGEGVQFYITAVNLRQGRLSLAATLLKFPATLITLAGFGSGGTVGPLARICAGAGSWITGRTIGKSPLRRSDDLAVGAICGVAGAISAIFHAPLAAGLYATEVLRRESIRYTDLIGALLSAVAAYVTSRILLGEAPFFVIEAPRLELSAAQTAWLPVVAVLGGLVGMLYIFSIDNFTSLFRRIPGGQPWRALAAAVLMSACIYFGLDWAFRTSPDLYTGLAEGDFAHITEITVFTLERVFPFILILLAKIILTSVTIGCGMSAGFTGPLIILGMTLGALVSVAAGVEPVEPAYFGFMACGMAALLSATLNIPLAAIALTMAVFGTSYILPAVTGSTLAFFIFKGSTVYHYMDATNAGLASAPRNQETTGNDGRS